MGIQTTEVSVVIDYLKLTVSVSIIIPTYNVREWPLDYKTNARILSELNRFINRLGLSKHWCGSTGGPIVRNR